MRFQQAAKLQQRRRVGDAFLAQVDADESTQRRAVEQCVLARRVGEIEPLLHEVHAQHPLQAHRRAPVARLGIVRLDDGAQLCPRHDLLHRRQKRIPLRRSAVLLVLRVLVGGHGESLLLHERVNARSLSPVDLISIALTQVCHLALRLPMESLS